MTASAHDVPLLLLHHDELASYQLELELWTDSACGKRNLLVSVSHLAPRYHGDLTVLLRLQAEAASEAELEAGHPALG